MELTNEFSVPVPIDRAWEVLNDVELIAPCMPGAELQEIEGDEYRGVVKVKVGPITAQYKGTAKFKEQDVDSRRLVLEAGGRDTRGQGSADAVITVTMAETDGSTHVEVHSDVTIKGKVVDVIGPGGVFGEMALVDQWERTALAFGQRVDDERYAEMQELSRYRLPYVAATAIARGPVVVVGRGAQSMLAAREDALHVFCYARRPALVQCGPRPSRRP